MCTNDNTKKQKENTAKRKQISMIIRDLPLDTLGDVAIMHTNTQRRLCMGIPHGGNQAQAEVKFIDSFIG